MARRSSLFEDLIDISAKLPWWVAVILGGASYVLFTVYLPIRASGPHAAAFTPIYNVLGWAFLGACFLGAAINITRRIRDGRLFGRQSSLASIRNLSWQDFERFVLEAYRRQGYDVESTSAGTDGGVDIELRKDGKTTLVQCKQWKTRRVGVKPIRELAGVVAAEGADRGMFVCSGGYTAEAEAFARKSTIELIDGWQLAQLLRPSILTRGEMASGSAESCPRCGSNLVRRVARRGRTAGNAFMGCSQFPKCRFTRNV